MPRKQRFKPSRKPKPIPHSEAQTIGNDARTASAPGIAHNDSLGSAPLSSRMSDTSSSVPPEPDHR
jgi:hypothetical protein